MENKEIIKELVKLQILSMRWVERNTTLICATNRDMDRILTNNKLTCTYSEGVQNLKNNIIKFCRESNYLVEGIAKLQENIETSTIKDLRFGVEPQKKFSSKEKELDNYKLQRAFFMTNEMVGIKYIVEKFGLTESAVKQACQQERLMNTKKFHGRWMVHIPEVVAYWDIEDAEYTNLEY